MNSKFPDWDEHLIGLDFETVVGTKYYDMPETIDWEDGVDEQKRCIIKILEEKEEVFEGDLFVYFERECGDMEKDKFYALIRSLFDDGYLGWKLECVYSGRRSSRSKVKYYLLKNWG